MKSIRRGIAVLLAVLLMIPNMPATAREALSETSITTEGKEEALEVKESSETEKSSEEGNADPSEKMSETETSSDTPESSATEETVSEETSKEETVSEETSKEETVSEETSKEESVSEEFLTEETETEQEESETEEINLSKAGDSDMVQYNTGSHMWSVVSASDKVDENEKYFDADGSYTIKIPELNPFFPYEVQFTYNGEVTNEWFMTPDDSVEIGGHVFRVSADFDNTVLTQMSLNVAGTSVVVYPEKKTFTDEKIKENENHINSLLPLEERTLSVDLTGFSPIELTMVSMDRIFTGENVLSNVSKVMWTYSGDDGYQISESGDKLNLSYHTSSAYDGTNWEMIVGKDDQLDASNIRYIVNVKVTGSRDWLVPTVYKQDENGVRTSIPCSNCYYDDWAWKYDPNYSRNYYYSVKSSDLESDNKTYLSLNINSSVFSNVNYYNVKVYDGKYNTAEEAMAGTEITNKIWNVDMTKADAGYPVTDSNSKWITILCFDSNGKVTGCLPFYFWRSTTGDGVSIEYYRMFKLAGTEKINNIYETVLYDGNNDGYNMRTIKLFKEFVASDTYYLPMNYEKDGKNSNNDITAAYAGKYSTIAEATASNATNIKEQLFGEGYPSDYSNTVYFSIFAGEDGSENQKIYHYGIKTVTGTKSKDELSLDGSTLVRFDGLVDANGNQITDCYAVPNVQDSYSEYNYLTLLVGKNVDITNVAPTFKTKESINLYADDGTKQKSGESFHDFSKGTVHYTASAENKENKRNYYLQIIKETDNAGWLYVNSLADPDANTIIENGVTTSTREVRLDGFHDNVHNILLANMGASDINKLSVELVSDTLQLDDYWTLKGDNSLSKFSGTKKGEQAPHGELPNLAKVRLRLKSGLSTGRNVSGTLTFKSGETVLLVLKLIGTSGNPYITTEEIPEAVKYVPYGTMIQDSCKYDWYTISYRQVGGTLPEGVSIMPNGELYGVPKEVGEFKFTVQMTWNSGNSSGTDKKEFTLNVKDNTNANVDASTDENYTVTQRIPDIKQGKSGSDKLFVSQGVYVTFKKVFLDGEQLTEGVDFVSESGSTRITVKAETLDKLPKGRHTLGVEFREEDDILKKAAQNFNVKGKGDLTTDNNNQTDGNGSQTSENASESTNDRETTNNAKTETATNAKNTSTAGLPNIPSNSNSSEILENVDVTQVVQYTVVSGDTLWKISKKFYGSGKYWRRIYEDNADRISNPDQIYAGHILMIYLTNIQIATNATANPNTNSTGLPASSVNDNLIIDESDIPKYIVKSGDTLWKIAKKLYGRGWEWRKIYEANANIISSPNKLHVGQLLVIPK